MSFTSIIQAAAIKSLSELYGSEFSAKDFQINETKPEFKGDYTIVLFALVKTLKKSPEALGNELGENLL
jgi:arginyl-tRNA synthetase